MRHISRGIRAGVVVAFAVSIAAHAQEFKLFDRAVQVHGFASQGFVHTNDNNWLTMNTSHFGSGQFTDFGANTSVQVTDRFRIGAQIYGRELGQLGRWRPDLDWAVADFHFQPWMNFRGGKIKTAMGLYNDTQDLDFLHAFVLLPQSIYPTDMRDSTIAHTGGDIYGTVRLRDGRWGVLSYTAYAGDRRDSKHGGYTALLSPFGINLSSYGGLQYGADLRWRTPLKGLMVGVSRMNEQIVGKGTYTSDVPIIPRGPYKEWSKADWTNQYFGQYTRGKLTVDSEYRRYWRDQIIFNSVAEVQTDVRGWYFAGAYQLFKHLQLGSYYSHYTMSVPLGGNLQVNAYGTDPGSRPDQHDYDKVVSARVDLNRFWNFKVESHFMAGYGGTFYPNGFYDPENPNGFQPNTNALVVKTGFNF